MQGDVGAALGDAQIGLFLPGIGFGFRQFEGFFGMALDKVDGRLADHLQAVQIGRLLAWLSS